MPAYSIALARPTDLRGLAAVERAAARLLEGHAPESVLSEVTDAAVFRTAQADGRLWVALTDTAPVGFALVEMLADDLPHLQEVAVHPAHGRQGLGTALVQAACRWAVECGYRELTLTTFRALRWNMPFYASLGFEEIPAGELGPELIAIVLDETGRGLDPASRLAMRYRCASPNRPSREEP